MFLVPNAFHPTNEYKFKARPLLIFDHVHLKYYYNNLSLSLFTSELKY